MSTQTQDERAGRSKMRFGGMVLLGLLLACSGNAIAQNQPSAADLKMSPLALREFEPPADAPYELGRGDDISIDVAGHPELSAKRTVGPDGRITLPLVGALQLAGLTREGAGKTIQDALSVYYARPDVTVGVDRYTSNRILLLGAVENPGVVTFAQAPTLLEALTRGGSSTGAEGGSTYGSGGGGGGGSGGSFGQGGGGGRGHGSSGLPERCAIYRGTDKVMWVDVKGMLDSGSALVDMRLKRDDIIYVPSPTERYVSMLGQVQHPGALILENNSTLPKLLAESGGITLQAGDNPQIEVISPSTGKTRIIPFKQLLLPGKLDLTLRTGDLIYVPESGFNKFTYVLERLSPLVTVFTAAAIFNR